MISLKKTIEAYDYRSMWQAALESYVAAIESLEKNSIGVDHPGVNQYRAKLQALKSRLESVNATPQSLRDLSNELDEELKQYRCEIESLIKESTHDLKDVVSVLAQATESLSQRENLHSGQLSRISGGLEAISQINDLAQVRITLNRQVSELRSCISKMSHDNESALAGLQKEIQGFQKRLEKVQIEASTDPLTGVANRRRCLREISNRIQARSRFGILVFDLNKFKSINDTLGHTAGDTVLQTIARRLTAQVRHDDLVCRWGGDEFVVVQDAPKDALATVGKEILRAIAGKITISHNGREHQVSIGAEFGWAEYQAPETPEDLFARADKMLYRTKSPQPLPPPIEIPVVEDATTGLRKVSEASQAVAALNGDLSSWFLACFAIRSAAKVNNHYGFPATETVMPFLLDAIQVSGLGGKLFRGRGASILAPVNSRNGSEAIEEELSRICAVEFEKHVKQKRRASILPIRVSAKAVSLAAGSAVQQINMFVDAHGVGEPMIPALAAVR
jgi:diguanylate cyclase